MADSPADKAGIKSNDVLVKIDGKNVPANVEEFMKLVAGLKTEPPSMPTVLRKGASKKITGVTLPAEPATAADPAAQPQKAAAPLTV